ncbi:MAG TPA: hypothetical protein EYP17_00855 [Candidatus Latescibacteria bacterium]|nr:hypothetical protein [Candidatus Latescibacterota bacterium]
MRSTRLWIGVAAMVVWFLPGCGSKAPSTLSEPVGIQEATEALGGEGVPTGEIAFHVRYVLPSGRLAKVAAVDKMTAYVYEPDGTKIAEANLERVGDRGKVRSRCRLGTIGGWIWWRMRGV